MYIHIYTYTGGTYYTCVQYILRILCSWGAYTIEYIPRSVFVNIFTYFLYTRYIPVCRSSTDITFYMYSEYLFHLLLFAFLMCVFTYSCVSIIQLKSKHVADGKQACFTKYKWK